MAPPAAARSGLLAASIALLTVFLAVGARSEAGPFPPARPGRSAIRSVGLAGLPRPDHTVVVIMENHAYGQIIGSSSAPYINYLRTIGANFTASYGVGHPSEPNYLALFAGTTEGLTDDSCPHTYFDENLATRLVEAGLTFAGYSESMPSDGYTGCESGNYARKHNPWVNFPNVPPTANLRFSRFPSDYSLLPTVSIVVPDQCSDMHDCSVATGDAWLSKNIDAYVSWAMSNNSLLVLTFDESDPSNQVTTLFVGPMVVQGDSSMRIDHYAVLRTLEDMYALPATGNAATAPSILGVWITPTPTPTPTRTPPPSAPHMTIHRVGAPPGPAVVPFAPTPRH